jgi:hypothetical membrane protein
MKKLHPSFICGLAACAGYLVFAILAYLHYPPDYSPWANWLSDLGNPVVNPGGAGLYNAGVILTAVLLVMFFLGLYSWKINGNRVQMIMLRLTQVFGILGSLSMLMSAVYPISQFSTHAFLSTMLYISLSTAFIFSAAMLRYHRNVPRWLLILGVSTAIIVLMTSIFQDVTVLEWITVFLYLGYVSMLSLETRMAENLAMQSDSG